MTAELPFENTINPLGLLLFTQLNAVCLNMSAFAVVLWIILKLVLKNTQKSALLTTIIFVMIFFYGHIESLFTELIANQLIFFLQFYPYLQE